MNFLCDSFFPLSGLLHLPYTSVKFEGFPYLVWYLAVQTLRKDYLSSLEAQQN